MNKLSFNLLVLITLFWVPAFAQKPNISVPAIHKYYLDKAITPVNITNTGGAVQNKLFPRVSKLLATQELKKFVIAPSGNIYSIQYYSIMLTKPNGVASRLAGFQGGYADGTGEAARFESMNNITLGPDGNLYVTEENNKNPYNCRVRKITPAGVVTTFASGLAGALGIAFDNKGILYVVENNGITKIDKNGNKTPFVGQSTVGSNDGSGNQASFNGPRDITIDKNNNIYVADEGNYLIRKVTPGGTVSTIAGSKKEGSADGTGTAASFRSPRTIRVDSRGNLMVLNPYNELRMINPEGTVTTISEPFYYDDNTGYGFSISEAAIFDQNDDIIMYAYPNGLYKMRTLGYSISPGLPAGLTLSTDGIISGTPTQIAYARNYTITASNTSGFSAATFKLEVVQSTDAPQITSISPKAMYAGGDIIINGKFFTGVTKVTIGGKQTVYDYLLSSTQIKATVPAGAKSGDVTVTTPYGTASVSGFQLIPPPAITAVSPLTGMKGTKIKITGTDLASISNVAVGYYTAVFKIISKTEIEATLGDGGTGDIEINGPSGQSSFPGFVFIGPPTIASVSPGSSGIGTTVTINGTELGKVTSVKFGGVEASSFKIISATQLKAVIAPGSGNGIRLEGPSGSSTFEFYILPPPIIQTVTPTRGAENASFYIYGENLSGAEVTIGGTPAIVNYSNSYQISGTIGVGSVSGDLVVRTNGGTATYPNFFVLKKPVITDFEPKAAGTGEKITITGTNFDGVNMVRFGNGYATFTVLSPTSIEVIVPDNSGGVITVSSEGGSASLAGFTYTGPAIYVVSPSSASTGQTVKITGVNFKNITEVTFGGVPATSFKILSETEISAVVGQGRSGSVTVKGSAGSGYWSGFTHPGPVIYYLSTYFAGPLSVTPINISGNNFTGATAVSFGGVPAASFTVVSATSINAMPAANSKSGDVTITTPNGSDSRPGFMWLEPPTISAISPDSQKAGGPVTITGTNLLGIKSVTFGGVPAAGIYAYTGTSINAYVGYTGASGDVIVETVGGTATIKGFKFTSPAIDTIAPASAAAGQNVSIKGSSLNTITSVQFGNTEATSFTIVSPTKITAVVAPGSGDGIILTGSSGNVYYPKFTFIRTPYINSCTPDKGGKDTEITINGGYLLQASEVKIGGVAAKILTVENNRITARVGNGATGKITIRTPGGTAEYNGFAWYPAPTIISASPMTAVAGMKVTLKGTNFTGVTAVMIGDAHVYYEPVSATSITVHVPDYVTSGGITVTTIGGTATLPGFKFISAPVISSFVKTGDGSTASVVIFGKYFYNVTEVAFGGVAAKSFKALSDTSISAKPGNGATGEITVRATGGVGVYRGYLYKSPPVIASFSPINGPLGSTVTITGNNFNTDAAKNVVYLGPLKATVKNASKTSLQVIVPGGGGNRITVTDISSNLSAKSNSLFTVTNTSGKVSFTNKTEIPLSTYRYMFNDFDEDGNPDILMLRGDTVCILQYGSDKVLSNSSFRKRTDLMSGRQIFSINIEDIDGDGKKDILLGWVYSVIVLRNTSTGKQLSFEEKTLEYLNGQAGLGMQDMDMDGRPDLLQGNRYYQNTSSAETGISFGKYVELYGDGGPKHVVDIDGDNKPDGLGTGQYGGISLFKNNSVPGGFTAEDYQNSSFYHPGFDYSAGYFITADFDGDNKPDLVEGGVWKDFCLISRNTSVNGAVDKTSFSNTKKFNEGALKKDLIAADMNGDGKLDLVLPSYASIDYFKNQSAPGSITLALPVAIIKPVSNYESTTVADVDGDGRADIILSDTKNNKLVIIHNGPGVKPQIISAYPLLGGTGSRVTIIGKHLEGATSVSFGDKPAKSFTSISSDTLVAVVGEGATGAITVKTVNGDALIAGFKFSKGQTVTYGTADFNPRPGVQGITYASSDAAVATIVAGKIHTSGAGVTTITATIGGNIINEVLTVKKAVLTVTANNISRTYSESNPELTVSYSGFINGDTQAGFSTPPMAVTTANITSPVGSYPITVSGGESVNYTFKYVQGTLAVKPYSSITYGMPDFNPKPGVPGIVYTSSNTNIISIVAGKLHINNAGVTTITAKVGGLVFSQPLTVKKAVLTIKANDKTKNAGAANPPLDVTYTGFVYSENASVLSEMPVVKTTAAAASPIGSYPITAAGAVSNNYDIKYIPGTLTIVVPAANQITNAVINAALNEPDVAKAVSPNADGINDVLIITDIRYYPENKLQIMNSKGVQIKTITEYDNQTKVFDGHDQNGTLLPAGTYFYRLEYEDSKETKQKLGYIVLVY